MDEGVVNHVHPTEDNQVLFIVIGHSNHNDMWFLFALKNHVHMLSLPPHMTHTQALDCGVIKPS